VPPLPQVSFIAQLYLLNKIELTVAQGGSVVRRRLSWVGSSGAPSATLAAPVQQVEQHLPLPTSCPSYIMPCRPDYTDYAGMARWLVHQNEWGVVSTTSRHLGGIAFGNALSFADGPR
jgi:hypothetical protein